MDYQKILKKSLVYSWKYKFLWILGVLTASGSYYSGGNYTFSPDAVPESWPEIKGIGDFTSKIFNVASAKVNSLGQVLGESIGPNAVGNIWIWMVLAMITLVILVIIIYLNVTARGAIIWAVDDLDKNDQSSLKTSWKAGHRYFWRMFSLVVISVLVYGVPLLVLMIPVIILAVYEMLIMSVVLGLLFGLIYFAYVVFLSLIIPYAERFLILKNFRAMNSIYEGKKLLGTSWKEIVIMLILIFVSKMLAGIGIAIAIILAALIAVPLGMALSYLSPIILPFYIGTMLLVLFVFGLVVTGFINSFASSAVTLTFKELKK